jgi:hypothetical protein
VPNPLLRSSQTNRPESTWRDHLATTPFLVALLAFIVDVVVANAVGILSTECIGHALGLLANIGGVAAVVMVALRLLYRFVPYPPRA